jgi:hypothetical protein
MMREDRIPITKRTMMSSTREKPDKVWVLRRRWWGRDSFSVGREFEEGAEGEKDVSMGSCLM